MISKLRVYQKVIVVFVAMIVPVYLNNFGMNRYGISFMKEGAANSILSNIQFYSSQLNDQIAFVRTQQLQLLGDSDLQKLGFLGEFIDDYEDVQLVNRVSERLAAIRNSSEYLVNVGVGIRSLGKSISTQGRITKLPNSEFSLISESISRKPALPIYFHSGRLFFIESGNNGNIIVYMELSVPKLKSTLQQLIEYYRDSGALLMDERFDPLIEVKAGQSMAELIQGAGDFRKPDQPTTSRNLKADGQNYMLTQTQIRTLGLTLYTYINQEEITGPLKKFNLWSTSLSIISLAVVLIFAFSVNVMIHRPLKRLIGAFKKLEADNLISSFRNQPDNEFGYLYRNFDVMVDNLRQSIKENYEQKIALHQSELKQLQSQINPHFLYNSFFNLYMICKSGDADSAASLAQKLGSYYRFITRSGKDETLLEEEYRHALDYCEIQSVRFSNRITVEAQELPEYCRRIEVPRLIIQPIVENAFEHAFGGGTRRGTIDLSANYGDNLLSIVVEDDGGSMTDESLRVLKDKLEHATSFPEKTGIVNVCSRIRLKFGARSGVFVSRGAKGGLKAEIRIHFDSAMLSEGAGEHVPFVDRG